MVCVSLKVCEPVYEYIIAGQLGATLERKDTRAVHVTCAAALRAIMKCPTARDKACNIVLLRRARRRLQDAGRRIGKCIASS